MADLITRQAAVDAICKACTNGDDYVNCRDRDIKSTWCDNMAALRDLPSAQPERWIPCSERLPNDDTEVIVSCTDDSGDSEFSYTTTGWHFKGLWVVGNERSYFVRAWMPLPEPYAERRTDE